MEPSLTSRSQIPHKCLICYCDHSIRLTSFPQSSYHSVTFMPCACGCCILNLPQDRNNQMMNVCIDIAPTLKRCWLPHCRIQDSLVYIYMHGLPGEEWRKQERDRVHVWIGCYPVWFCSLSLSFFPGFKSGHCIHVQIFVCAALLGDASHVYRLLFLLSAPCLQLPAGQMPCLDLCKSFCPKGLITLHRSLHILYS